MISVFLTLPSFSNSVSSSTRVPALIFANFVSGFLIVVDFLKEGFQIRQFDLGFYGKVEGAFADGFVDGGAGDVDGVGVGAAMEFDFVGELDAIDGAVVVVENFLVEAGDGCGFLDEQMGLRIEEEFAADVGSGGEFELESVSAADLSVADEGDG